MKSEASRPNVSLLSVWWRLWSDTLWETLIRLWLHSSSFYLQIAVVEISLQFCGYVDVVSPCSHRICMFLRRKREKLMWMAGQCGYVCGVHLLFFMTMFSTLGIEIAGGQIAAVRWSVWVYHAGEGSSTMLLFYKSSRLAMMVVWTMIM